MKTETDRIHIIFPGDPSTGIFPAKFELKEVHSGAGSQPIEFEDKESMDGFMKGLAELFEQYITGYQCRCITNEQWLDSLAPEKSPTYGRNRPN